jgi:hypothetical protein
MKGYKAFNKDMKCRDFQFEENKEFEQDDKVSVCNKGFHFCENPMDVLDYYDLVDSEFSEVEATGDIKTEGNKSATNKIKIGAKLGVKGLVKASFDFLWEKCYIESESKDSSKLASSGHSSKLASSGDYSKLEVNGLYSVGASIGVNSKIKGKIGNWITLTEWNYSDGHNKPVCVKSAQIDGVIIKEDVFYTLKNGEFIEQGEE